MEKCLNQERIKLFNEGSEGVATRLEHHSYGSAEDIHIQNEVIAAAEAINKVYGCQSCDGMVTDLSTGKLYCGREVPPKVTASNEKILED